MAGMDFRGGSAKVRRLLAPTNPAKLSKSALTEDTLRDNVMRESESRNARFRKAIRKTPEIQYADEDGNEQTYSWDTFPEMMRDAARAAFGWDEPQARPREQVRPSHRLNREILQSFVSSPEFSESRPYTRNSEIESQYGAMAAAKSLEESAAGTLAEHIAHSNKIDEAEQDSQSTQDLWEKLKKQAKRDVADAGTVKPGTRHGIKQNLKAQQAAQTNLSNLMQQQLASGMTTAAIGAGQEAAQAAQEASDLISSLPGVEPGSAHKIDADAQIALAEKWAAHEHLRRIALRLGRTFRSFRFKREARVKNVKIEPVGITTGRDLERLLPQELAKAYITGLRPLFIKEWAEGKLLQYEMTGKAPAGKGPIIVVIDGSGSMTGEPFIYASSIELALYMEARKTHRAFAAVEFGSQGEVASWLFPRDEPDDPDKVFDMASHFFGGGTDISGGMELANDIITADVGFTTADVVLVSDGQDRFGEDDKRIRDELVARHVRIHGITIGTGANPYFEQMCEWHMDVSDLAKSEDAILGALAENLT